MRKENKLDFTKCGVQLFVSNPVGNLPAVLLSSFYLIHRRIRHLKQSGKFFISCGIEHGANTHTEGILGKGQHNAFRPTAQQSIQQAGQLLFLNIRQENQEFIPAEPAAKAVRRHGIPNARRHLMNNPITKDMTVGIIVLLEKVNVRDGKTESCIIFAPGNAIYAKLEVTYVIKVSCATFPGFLFPFILVSNAACSF